MNGENIIHMPIFGERERPVCAVPVEVIEAVRHVIGPLVDLDREDLELIAEEVLCQTRRLAIERGGLECDYLGTIGAVGVDGSPGFLIWNVQQEGRHE